MVDTIVYRRFGFRDKTDGIRGHLTRRETSFDRCSSEERLFANSPPIGMANNKLHRGSVFLPYLLAVYDPVFKK